MTFTPKGSRRYPYNTGLLLGTEFDIVLTNENSEPIDPATVLPDKVCKANGTGGGEWSNDDNMQYNRFKVRNGMVRGYSRYSYCRAYSTDNVWWIMKTLIIELKKKAFLSFVPQVGEDSACGHMSFRSTQPGIYDDSGDTRRLYEMTFCKTNEAHERLCENLRLTLGLINMLLDRRESAEKRRVEYGPFSDKEFRKTKSGLTYQTINNFWLFSPILSHMMLGAGRFAYFITLNNIESEIWEGFESNDIKYVIHNNDYDTAEEIWELLKVRFADSGYKPSDNPFNKQMSRCIDFFIEYGLGVIGSGVYKNWRMSRKSGNYRGHFEDLPSWEGGGAVSRVFGKNHPLHEQLTAYIKDKSNA